MTNTTYTLTEREIPFDGEWDVVVAGGGPAGCAAAAAAAREGARTLLVESTGALGGMGTSGLVPAWCPFSDKEKIIYRGLAERVFDASKRAARHVDPERLDWVPIDPEALKRIYDDLLADFGVEARFFTDVVDVDAADGSVSALVLSSKAGLTACRGAAYVDCTGDADLAVRAGAAYVKGDDDGDLQPATHCFILSNVDTYAYCNGDAPWRTTLAERIDRERYPDVGDLHLCNSLIGPDTVGFNTGHLWEVDNTDPTSVSRAMAAGRKLALQFRDALAEYHPRAFANSFLVSTGALMGIRETRRIVGDYVLTIDDYLAARSFDDEICRNAYFVDIHTSKKEFLDALDSKQFRGGARRKQFDPGQSHGVPYRCLLPKGVRNVTVAGRSISTDRDVQGSTRVMPVCLAMGEAAGMAAAHAAAGDGDVHAVDTDRLRDRLREEGAYLP